MAPDLPPKRALHEELSQLLASDLDTLEGSQRAAQEGATHEEAKPENDKDTRAIEQSYLARGQAKRIEELRSGLAAVSGMLVRKAPPGSRVGLGSLVTAEEGGSVLVFFVAPHGGGAKLACGRVSVVTPRSPLGRELVGKLAGDDVTVRLEGRTRELSVVDVD